MQAAKKNLKVKAKVKNGGAKGRQVNGEEQDQLFCDFVYSNPELPERDREILSEIEDHRQAVISAIEFKRNSCHKIIPSSRREANDLIKSQTDLVSLKSQVMEQSKQNSAQKSTVGS